jgi:hypothetical protein
MRQIVIDRGRIDEPASCPQCQGLAALEMIHNRCLFSDKQVRFSSLPHLVLSLPRSLPP